MMSGRIIELVVERTPLIEQCLKIMESINMKACVDGWAYKKFMVNASEFNSLSDAKDREDEFILIDGNILSDMVKTLVKEYGFEIDEKINETNHELHYGWSSDERHVIESNFTIHQDDYGGTSYPTVTCIIYLDVCCVGGELEFFENDEDDAKCTRQINTQNPSNGLYKVVIFNGSLYHNAAPYWSGHRRLISFQFPRKI